MKLSDYHLTADEWDYLIEQWIVGVNAERDREILKRRIIDGIYYEPLAEEFGISPQRIKAIVKKRKKELLSNI